MTDGLTALRAAAGSALSPALVSPAPKPAQACTVESRPLSACEDILAAWNGLGRRAVAPNPFLEPGFLLPAAQHLVAFREVAALLVWQGGPAERERRLVGLMPYRRRSRLLRPDALSGCTDARLLCDWPLLDRDAAGPALSALLRALQGAGPADAGLRLHAIAADNPVMAPLAAAIRPDRLLREPRPFSHAEIMDAAAARDTRYTLREAASLTELRDGVEILMAFEASGPLGRAGRASVQDTREAAFLRAMTRNLARGRLCRMALLMEGERPVAAALTLGRGKRRWLYKAAAEGGAASALATLLTLLQRATPGLSLLARGDRPVLADQKRPVCDLVVTPAGPRRPADLARGLRARLDRALFRPRPLAAGE